MCYFNQSLLNVYLFTLILAFTSNVNALGKDTTTNNPVDIPNFPFDGLTNSNLLIDYRAFTRPEKYSPASQIFNGRLSFDFEPQKTHIKIIKDDYSTPESSKSNFKDLPALDIGLVQVGDRLAPEHRGFISNTDNFWEWIIEPGYVWEESEASGISRAVIPAALQLHGWNCTHNGAITFLYRSNGELSDVYFQIAQETCPYFQFDLVAFAKATYTPGTNFNQAQLTTELKNELSNRLPTKPIEEISKDFPKIDSGDFGSKEDLDPASLTAYGLVLNGIHYVGGCKTRAGYFPFCDEVDIPSFSVAKTIAASMGMMRLESIAPKSGDTKIHSVIPECAAEGGWKNISLLNALDMATGRYVSDEALIDDDTEISAIVHESQLHNELVEFGCGAYPVKTGPGKKWVYHTSDTYLVGLGLHQLWKRFKNDKSDFFDEVLKDDVYLKLRLSPTLGKTRRTADETNQPYFGTGLTLLRDDFAKIGAFLSKGDGKIDDEQLFPKQIVRASLQRNEHDHGIQISENARYNNGFWAIDVREIISCDHPVWISYASGYGGVTLMFAPNGITYYYVSDGEEYSGWNRAIHAINEISQMCKF